MNITQIKKIDWQRIEKNRKTNLFPVLVPGWTYIIDGSKKATGIKQNNILSVHVGTDATFYCSHKEWDKIGRFVLKRILKSSSWGFSIDQKIISRAHKLVNFSEKFTTRNIQKKSIEELIDSYQQYEKLHGELYHYAIIPVFLDLYQPLLSDYLMNYLELRKLKVFSASEVFGILTTPDKPSQVQKEELALMDLAIKIKADSKARKIFSQSVTQIKKDYLKINRIGLAITKHYNQYHYQGYNWVGPSFSLDYFLKRLKEFVADKDLKEKIIIKKSYNKKVSQNRKQYLQAINLDQKHQKLFELTRDFIYSKDYRKDLLVKSYWHLESLLAELAPRLNLSFREVRNLTILELKELATGKKITKEQRSRLKSAVYVVFNGKIPGPILSGKKSFEIANYFIKKEKVSSRVEVSGQVAYPGKVVGIVRIVEHPKEVFNIKKGDILVTHMTNPDLVPGMKLAGAIVTETGGITCHAAILSRELGKPCVIGTKIATRIFKDGDKVEVDANNGIIKKI